MPAGEFGTILTLNKTKEYKFMRRHIRFLTHGAIIGAVYAVLTLATWSFSSMQIQLRVAEALTVLPLFTPAAIPGLFIGCLVANLMSGNVIDALFGSLTTLLAALLTYFIGQKIKGKAKLPLAVLPPILLNAVAVPLILYFGYGFKDFLGFDTMLPVLFLNALSVLIGQFLSCGLLGAPLYFSLSTIEKRTGIFSKDRSRRE